MKNEKVKMEVKELKPHHGYFFIVQGTHTIIIPGFSD
jgi:hypothetical protein